MPTRSLTACSHPGCGVACVGGRCPKHKRTTWAKPNGRDTHYDTAAWRKLSAAVIARDPVCRMCSKRKSKTADHIIARRDGGKDVMSNLQGACWPCHAQKTRLEQMKREGKQQQVSIKKQAVQPIWDD